VPDPVDFLQTSDGDLDLSLGLRRCPDRVTFVTQKLRENFNFWEGEWFLDQRLGVPYFKHVIGQHFDAALMSDLFRSVALKTQGVGSVPRLAVAFDGPTRELTVSMAAATTQGEILPAVDLVIDLGAVAA
jgi:hypothetical protein